MPYNKMEILKLPVEEKLELVKALWDQIDEDLVERNLSQEQMNELDKRINNITQHPENLVSWEDVKAKMKM